MAVLKKEQKEEFKNVLLRVSIPAPLMNELKKTKKLCRDNGFVFEIKPDIIEAITKAVAEAKELVINEKEEQDGKIIQYRQKSGLAAWQKA